MQWYYQVNNYNVTPNRQYALKRLLVKAIFEWYRPGTLRLYKPMYWIYERETTTI